MRKRLSISDVAKESDVTTRTIRFYEEQGLLTPERQGGERTFTAKDQARLHLILRGKRIGFSLAECREILEVYETPGEIAQKAEATLIKIKEKKITLEKQASGLNQLIFELNEIQDELEPLTICYSKRETQQQTHESHDD